MFTNTELIWIKKYTESKDSYFKLHLDMNNNIKKSYLYTDTEELKLNSKKFKKFMDKANALYSKNISDMVFTETYKEYTLYLLPIFLQELQRNGLID